MSITKANRAGRTQSKIAVDPLRIIFTKLRIILNKLKIGHGCHAELWSFHITEVPSNSQLTFIKWKICTKFWFKFWVLWQKFSNFQIKVIANFYVPLVGTYLIWSSINFWKNCQNYTDLGTPIETFIVCTYAFI